MHESDLEAEEALARRGVDQLGAGAGEIRDRSVHVVDLVGDVMHAGSALRQKLADRCLVAERREELDAAVADAHRSSLDTLVLDACSMLEASAEEALVRLHRLVEVHDGDADVMDPSCFHSVDAIRRR